MKIAVLCANGKAGQGIVKEALARGLDVTAVVRGANRSAAQKAIIKDIMELGAEDLGGFEAVVDCFGTWSPETMEDHSRSLKHLCDLLSGTATRLLVVGGAGSLYLDSTRSVRVCDAPDFPDAYKPVAMAMARALDELRGRSDVRWTYISPACDFRPEGEREGAYLVGGEELLLNSRQESVISYADYALAMVDEIVSGNHIQQRIGVVRA